MANLVTPNHSNWNQYWSEDKTLQFTKVSWSKRRIMDILSPLAVRGQSALDAGCGSGFFSAFFLDRGMETVSLDYSDSALEITKKQTGGRGKILKADLVATDLAQKIPGRFDVIFSDGLLEHFSSADQDRILQNLISVLTEGGTIVTFVPNRFSPWELIRPFYMQGIDEKPFTLPELVRLNERNQLMVVQKGGVNTLPFSISPDGILGSSFGMLLYTVAQR